MRATFIFCLLTITVWSKAETFVYFQNNTSHDIEVGTTSALSTSYWSEQFSGTAEAWRLQTRIFSVNRDDGITWGDDFYLTTHLTIDGEIIDFQLKLTGNFVGSDIWQSASGPSFNHGWFGDAAFHSETFVVNGKQYTLKYRADLPPGNVWADIYYVLHEVDPYPFSSDDLQDSHVFNVLAYNVFMLTPPVGSSDEYVRSQLISQAVHGQDAVILSEAFYNAAREDNLIPLIGVEYPFHTSIVDDPDAAEDGGVMIFSRWPILLEDQHLFTDCNGSDCFAAKGVKYARINKSGVVYHLFGTHTQAWTTSDDIAVRSVQLTELKAFIDGMNLPETEAVLIGGDLNVDKIANHQGEYDSMFLTLSAAVPSYVGHPFTYNENYNNYASAGLEYLDYVLSENDHFAAFTSVNQPQILRTVASSGDLWDNNDLELDLSDHFAVQGRFVYPFFTNQPMAVEVCLGESFSLSINANVALDYQWFHSDSVIIGATDSVFNLSVSVLSDSGSYYCVGTYLNGEIVSDTVLVSVLSTPTPIITQIGNTLESDATMGNQWYDDNGPLFGETDQFLEVTNTGNYYVIVSENGCDSEISNVINVLFVGVQESVNSNGLVVFPNPTNGLLNLRFDNDIEGELLLELYNTNGKRVWIQSTNAQRQLTFDLGDFSSGNYILRVNSKFNVWNLTVILR